MLLLLIGSSLIFSPCLASFCGVSSIPFSLEILPDGQPVLGCARPTCFGWAPNGQPAVAEVGIFYQINEVPDGYTRAGRTSIPTFGSFDDRFNRPQTAICEPTFVSHACAHANQWVGGIEPQLNASAQPILLQCCAYDGVLQSEDRGVASLHAGEMVTGGEVVESGSQVGFDYISDIAKTVQSDGFLQYDVSIRRMPCEDPTDASVPSKRDDTAGQALDDDNLDEEEENVLPPTYPTVPPNAILNNFQPVLHSPPQHTVFQAPQVFAQPQFVPPPQLAAPQYPPTYCGGNTQLCFSGDMTVRTRYGGIKRMDELKKGDWVLAVGVEKVEYVPVEFWLHRVPTQGAVFNEFETKDGKIIKLTDQHFIFKRNCSREGDGPLDILSLPREAVMAERVRVGDCLFTLNDEGELHEVRIVRASKVKQTGIYAPMTDVGRILVNGVHASCHNIMQANAIGQSLFEAASRIHDAIFGEESNEVVETPAGLSTILAIADLIVPKNIVTI